MSQSAMDAAADQASRKRLVLSCFFGTTIEWYDFLLYAFLAPLVFDHLFFPKLDATVGTIAVFGIFAVGFAARPLGGLFFGHYGDRIGRKPVMAITLIMMGLSTALIGVLPTYASIGVWAPALLLLLRFLQGFALGGESTGAPVIMAESAPGQKGRGLFASLAQTGIFVGTVLATVLASAVMHMDKADMLSWGWRVPFILSLVLVLIGVYIRTKVQESPSFIAAIEKSHLEKAPLAEVVTKHLKPTIIAFCSSMTESSTFYLLSVFGLAYGAKNLGIDKATLLNGVLIGNAIGAFMIPFFGNLSDKFGRRAVLGTNFVLAALYLAFVFFPLLQTHNTGLILFAMALPGAILQPGMMGVSASFYPELFPDPRVRFSGCSLGRQLGAILGGGIMPMVATSLMAWSHGNLMTVIVYFCAVVAISTIAIMCAKDTRQHTI